MDMGLRNSRIHYRQMEETHSMENVIYDELRIRVLKGITFSRHICWKLKKK